MARVGAITEERVYRVHISRGSGSKETTGGHEDESASSMLPSCATLAAKSPRAKSRTSELRGG